MPTANLTRRAARLLIVVPDGELAAGYRSVADSFARTVTGEEDEPAGDVIERSVADLVDEELDDRSVLLLGEAVRDPAVAAFLGRTRMPAVFGERGFAVDGRAFEFPGQAIFATVHHPDVPELGVTVYYGNSEPALSNSAVLTYYPNSLLVFDTPPGGSDGSSGMPRAEVVLRRDFEFHDRIELTR